MVSWMSKRRSKSYIGQTLPSVKTEADKTSMFLRLSETIMYTLRKYLLFSEPERGWANFISLENVGEKTLKQTYIWS